MKRMFSFMFIMTVIISLCSCSKQVLADMTTSANDEYAAIVWEQWQDGQSDHVGIVEKVENGIVYTVEGNSGDSCRQNQYPVGHYEILGYGVPQY